MPEHDLDTMLSWRGRAVFDRKEPAAGRSTVPTDGDRDAAPEGTIERVEDVDER